MSEKYLRATIVGHSYIKYLERFRSDFNLHDYEVSFVYQSGATTSDLFPKLSQISSTSPHVVFIQVGGNDFSGHNREDHTQVPVKIMELASAISAIRSVQQVYIGKLFYRLKNRFLCSTAEVNNYNYKVDWINDQLSSLAGQLQNISLLHHKGREVCSQSWLDRDGTHLNSQGNKKFWRSIRGALLTSSRHLKHIGGFSFIMSYPYLTTPSYYHNLQILLFMLQINSPINS